MRMNPRFSRVRSMVTHESIPRSPNGVLRLCHGCQRWVHLQGGYLRMIVRQLEHDAMIARIKAQVAARNRRRAA